MGSLTCQTLNDAESVSSKGPFEESLKGLCLIIEIIHGLFGGEYHSHTQLCQVIRTMTS